MKQFIIKLLIALSLFLACVIIMLVSLDYCGISDDTGYKRLLSKNHSLIIGTSRSAQGMVPYIVDSMLVNSGYDLPINNFSFNVSYSPFGEVYYDAICRKIDTLNCNKKGLYIVAVDPFALCMEVTDWDKDGLREDDKPLRYMYYCHRPQFLYLLMNCRPHQWIHNNYAKLHDDGWLEVNANMDSLHVIRNVELKMQDYNKYIINKSEYRLHWLENTIELLKRHGDIYLIRIPVSLQMFELENSLWPDFDDDINNIALLHSVSYFSFIEKSGKYRTTDGNHIYKDDGKKFTRVVCDSIMSHIR